MIDRYSFCRSGLEQIVVPASVKSFGDGCFKGCSALVSFETAVPLEIDEIPESMFEDCTSLAYVGEIKARNICDRAFMNADLSDIAKVTASESYGDYAFYHTNLRYNNTFVPAGHTEEEREFRLYCQSIGAHCFEGCENLRDETVFFQQEVPPTLGTDAFKLEEGKITQLRLIVAEKYLYRYMEAGWDSYFETINIGIEYGHVIIIIHDGWDGA